MDQLDDGRIDEIIHRIRSAFCRSTFQRRNSVSFSRTRNDVYSLAIE